MYSGKTSSIITVSWWNHWSCLWACWEVDALISVHKLLDASSRWITLFGRWQWFLHTAAGGNVWEPPASDWQGITATPICISRILSSQGENMKPCSLQGHSKDSFFPLFIIYFAYHAARTHCRLKKPALAYHAIPDRKQLPPRLVHATTLITQTERDWNYWSL